MCVSTDDLSFHLFVTPLTFGDSAKRFPIIAWRVHVPQRIVVKLLLISEHVATHRVSSSFLSFHLVLPFWKNSHRFVPIVFLLSNRSWNSSTFYWKHRNVCHVATYRFQRLFHLHDCCKPTSGWHWCCLGRHFYKTVSLLNILLFLIFPPEYPFIHSLKAENPLFCTMSRNQCRDN